MKGRKVKRCEEEGRDARNKERKERRKK